MARRWSKELELVVGGGEPAELRPPSALRQWRRNAGGAYYPAGGNDKGERVKYRAELFDRGVGGGVRKGVVDTGRGRARPESDRDIQLWKRASRRGDRVAVPSLVCVGSLAAWLAVFRPEQV